VQIVVHGLEGDLGLLMKFFRALGAMVQTGKELYSAIGQKELEGRGPVGVVEPLEAIRWMGLGQDYTRILPVYQSFIPEVGDYSGHRPTLQAEEVGDIPREEHSL